MLYYLTEAKCQTTVHTSPSEPLPGSPMPAVNSLNQSGFNVALKAFGGWCGGTAGAVLPDIFDPPDHPGHRAMGHGIVPVGTASLFWAGNLGSWQESLRRSADQHHVQQVWGAERDVDPPNGV